MLIKKLNGETKEGYWVFLCNVKNQDIQVYLRFNTDTYNFRLAYIEPIDKRLRRHNGFLDKCKEEILNSIQTQTKQTELLAHKTIYEFP